MTEVVNAAVKQRSIAGRRFGRLVAIEFHHRDQWGAAHWRFRCDCGKEDYVCRPDQVRRGVITSCGCWRNEKAAKRGKVLMRKHGHAKKRSTEYVSWLNMNNRCYEPSYPGYHRYGGRGIVVCERWRHSFETFLLDMGKKPDSSYTIGRMNVDGNYEPNNCRWESKIQQARNKSTNRLVNYRGTEMPIAAACEFSGIPRNVFDARVRRGWTVEKALSTPVAEYSPRKPAA